MIHLQWLDLYTSIHDFPTYSHDSLIIINYIDIFFLYILCSLHCLPLKGSFVLKACLVKDFSVMNNVLPCLSELVTSTLDETW